MKDNDLDFDGALDKYVEVICDGGALVSGFIEAEDYQAIQFALALAKEMQSQEITSIKEMTDIALHDLGNPQPKESKQFLRDFYKAMVTELTKKVKEDLGLSLPNRNK